MTRTQTRRNDDALVFFVLPALGASAQGHPAACATLGRRIGAGQRRRSATATRSLGGTAGHTSCRWQCAAEALDRRQIVCGALDVPGPLLTTPHAFFTR